MLEIIRSTLLLGLGAGVITKEKADQAIRGLVEQGKLTKEEAERLANELVNSGSEQWHEVQDGLRESVRNVLESAGVARATDLQRLTLQLENAQQRIAMLEDQMSKLVASQMASPGGEEPLP